MNPEDERDYQAIKKLLDRTGKAVVMSAETETAEIIRRRLFEWGGLPRNGGETARAYTDWAIDHRDQLGDVDVDSIREHFAATYPFHPRLLSVFERKWQSLPRFQRTRGVLRLLALWVSQAYQAGYKGAHRDPLIGLGTAPLEDATFRAAAFEQLGGDQLEVPVTTDIAGSATAHARRLDREANETLRRARLHQKVATTIFMNGGTARAEATLAEIRQAVGEPDLDIANVGTALEALVDSSYYLLSERHRYRYSLSPNLNKLLTDRHATIGDPAVDEGVGEEIRAVFRAGAPALERIHFPEASGQIPDRAALALVVLPPDRPLGKPATRALLETLVREHGASGRTYKSALFFAVAESSGAMRDEARKLLAWEDVRDDGATVQRLEESQQAQLKAGLDRAARDLREAVWRGYRHVLLLGRDNALREIDLGLGHSSMASSLAELILNRSRQEDEVTESVGARKLVQYWPPALTAWSTKAARDAFYASPVLPRPLSPDAIRRTIVDCVAQKLLAYAGKDAEGRFAPLHFGVTLREDDVEISDDMFLLGAEEAIKHIEPPRLARLMIAPTSLNLTPRGDGAHPGGV